MPRIDKAMELLNVEPKVPIVKPVDTKPKIVAKVKPKVKKQIRKNKVTPLTEKEKKLINVILCIEKNIVKAEYDKGNFLIKLKNGKTKVCINIEGYESSLRDEGLYSNKVCISLYERKFLLYKSCGVNISFYRSEYKDEYFKKLDKICSQEYNKRFIVPENIKKEQTMQIITKTVGDNK